MSKKKRRKSGKGQAYEREICKKLSLWWTDGVRDDIYWRTANSGGRATVRKRMGKSTVGQYGDVHATDPIGKPLTRLCTIEIKRGYSGESFANLIERNQNPKVKESQFLRFIQQAEEERAMAKTYAWLLIVKRDRRKPMVIMPSYFYDREEMPCREGYGNNGLIEFWDGREYQSVVIVELDAFLRETSPEVVRRLWKKLTLRKKMKKRIQR